MIDELFVRHAMEMAIVFPAALMAFLPVRSNLRFRFPVMIASSVVFLTAFIFLGAAVCVRFQVETSFVLLPLLLLCFEVFVLAVRMSPIKKAFCFLNACMLSMFAVVYSVYLTAPLEPDDGPFTIRSSGICLLIAFLVCLFFYKTLSVKIPYLLQEDRLNRSWWILSLVLFALSAVLFYINPDTVSSIQEQRVRSVGLVALVLYPVAIYALYHLYWWTSVRLNESAQVKQENTVLNMEQKRYEELLNYMDETRTLRHDFRQHIRVIAELTADEQYGELKEYVGQLSGVAQKGYTPYCANMAVDALAAHYTSLGEEQKTPIDWVLQLPKKLPIPETDFCALMGNLLENALNATAKLPEERRKIIVLSSMLTDTMLGLTVDNPYKGKIRFNRDHLPVSREAGHGIGMPSVAATVKRYNGTLDIETKDGLFSVNIMLYPQSQN